MSESERLRSQLQRLSLRTMAQIFGDEALKASKTDRSVNVRMHKARLPMLRTLEALDFSFQPSLSPARVRELAHEIGGPEHARLISDTSTSSMVLDV